MTRSSVQPASISSLINNLLCTTSLLAPAQQKITLELLLLKHKSPDHDARLFYKGVILIGPTSRMLTLLCFVPSSLSYTIKIFSNPKKQNGDP